MLSIKHLLTRDRRNGVNISMAKINIRNIALNSRVQNYFICPILEQKHINDINKQLNK